MYAWHYLLYILCVEYSQITINHANCFKCKLCFAIKQHWGDTLQVTYTFFLLIKSKCTVLRWKVELIPTIDIPLWDSSNDLLIILFQKVDEPVGLEHLCASKYNSNKCPKPVYLDQYFQYYKYSHIHTATVFCLSKDHLIIMFVLNIQHVKMHLKCLNIYGIYNLYDITP